MRLPHRLALLGGLLWLAGLGQAFDRTIYVTNWSQASGSSCNVNGERAWGVVCSARMSGSSPTTTARSWRPRELLEDAVRVNRASVPAGDCAGSCAG